MHAVVKLTLDRAAVGIRGQDEPLPNRLWNLPTFQTDRPPHA